MTVIGHVVRVFGDLITIAIKEEFLSRIGRRGKFIRIITGKGVDVIGIVSGFNLIDELYRESGGKIEYSSGYSELSLSRNEVIISLLGIINGSDVERKIPAVPSPGDPVYELNEEELNKIFNRGDIEIGSLITDPNVKVGLDLNELCTKHLAILAMTGYGKSNTLAVLLLRLLNKLPHPRILLVDTHSEYIMLASNESPIRDKVTVFAPIGRFQELINSLGIKTHDLEIPYWLLTIDEWYSLLNLDIRATKQRRILRDAIRSAKREVLPGANVNDPVYFNIERLRKIIERSKDSSAQDLLLKLDDILEVEEYAFILNPLNSLSIMEREGIESVIRYVSRPILISGLKILALGGLSSEIQNAVVSMILRFMFRIAVEAKLRGTPIPTLIAIEEAHIYAPQAATPTRGILERIAKEGRKFGLGLIIISQRPRELSETVLAQCGNLIALRTVNPSDQQHIQRSLEDVTSMIITTLPGLGKGEAVISGPMVPLPCVVQIDAFENVAQQSFGQNICLGGKDINFRELWSKEMDEYEIQNILKSLLVQLKKDFLNFGEHRKSKGEKISTSRIDKSLDEFLN